MLSIHQITNYTNQNTLPSLHESGIFWLILCETRRIQFNANYYYLVNELIYDLALSLG